MEMLDKTLFTPNAERRDNLDDNSQTQESPAHHRAFLEKLNWRRGWDSNPRGAAKPPSDFESAPLWPLRYLSRGFCLEQPEKSYIFYLIRAFCQSPVGALSLNPANPGIHYLFR